MNFHCESFLENKNIPFVYVRDKYLAASVVLFYQNTNVQMRPKSILPTPRVWGYVMPRPGIEPGTFRSSV